MTLMPTLELFDSPRDLNILARKARRLLTEGADLWAPFVNVDPNEQHDDTVRPAEFVLPQVDEFVTTITVWQPGQHTDLHSHGRAGHAFVVVSGDIIETTMENVGLAHVAAKKTIHEANEVTTCQSLHVHRLAAGGDGAVTLHVFAPAPGSRGGYEQVGPHLRKTRSAPVDARSETGAPTTALSELAI